MGRKFDLKKECRHHFQRHKQGSKTTQRERCRLMLAVVEDLAAIRELPNRLSLVSVSHIEKLVTYWQSQGALPATIGNRLGALRTLNRLASLNIEIPCNEALGAVKSSTALPVIGMVHKEALKNITHPVTRTIIDCQIAFGLTKLESIRFNPAINKQEKSLFIHRDVAHNKKDRHIPILSEEQERCLFKRTAFTNNQQGLISGKFSEPLIKKLYQAECIYCQIDPDTQFRSFYAKQRLKQLKKHLDEPAALITLSQEMGFSAPNKLKRLLG